MGRKILFITTDQQRYDALGCNGGKIARTPNVDALAATGINYRRAHNQNVVCMPARSTTIRCRGAIFGTTPDTRRSSRSVADLRDNLPRRKVRDYPLNHRCEFSKVRKQSH
jgi:hypothetical protein